MKLKRLSILGFFNKAVDICSGSKSCDPDKSIELGCAKCFSEMIASGMDEVHVSLELANCCRFRESSWDFKLAQKNKIPVSIRQKKVGFHDKSQVGLLKGVAHDDRPGISHAETQLRLSLIQSLFTPIP